MKFFLTMKSSNAKTGPIPVSISSAETCPTSCPLKSNGCYAGGGPLRMHWDKVTKGSKGVDFDEFCNMVAAMPRGQLWRHNQAGDLPGTGDRIDRVALAKLAIANAGKRGFTYTHKPLNRDNMTAIRAANAAGFTVNVSANDAREAAKVKAITGLPVVCVLPAEITAAVQRVDGQMIVTCPATIRDSKNCSKCGLCAVKDRKFIIGFPAHGYAKNKASAVAKGA